MICHPHKWRPMSKILSIKFHFKWEYRRLSIDMQYATRNAHYSLKYLNDNVIQFFRTISRINMSTRESDITSLSGVRDGQVMAS